MEMSFSAQEEAFRRKVRDFGLPTGFGGADRPITSRYWRRCTGARRRVPVNTSMSRWQRP